MIKSIQVLATGLALSALSYTAQAQTGGVGIGTSSPNASTQLDLTSSSKGLLTPRLTRAQRQAIASPAQDLLVYQNDGQPGFWYYSGSSWTFLNLSPAGDNLGNHTATQNLNLAGYQLVGNGGSSGVAISSGGQVGVGTTAPSLAPDVNGSLRVRSLQGTGPCLPLAQADGTLSFDYQVFNMAPVTTGPTTAATTSVTVKTGNGPIVVPVASSNAYVANDDGNSLQIFDLSNLFSVV